MSHKLITFISLTLILLLAALFRFTGVNWDQGQYLHPDERFLVMVASSMKWPSSIQEYLDTDTSKLNPHNIGHSFYVYGTWPVILMKAVSEFFDKSMYGNIHLVIRPMSGVIDLLTLLLIFFITKRLSKNKFAALFSAAVYACMLLPIQLSHFGTVDPYMTSAITLGLFFLTFPPSFLVILGLGISTGLAIAAKVSSGLIVITVGLYFIYYFIKSIKNNNFARILALGSLYLLIVCCVFRLTMPYFFESGSFIEINQKVVNNLRELQQYMKPDVWFPPSIQWIHTPSLLHPILQLSFWGLGIPFTILSICSIVILLMKTKNISFLTFLPGVTMILFFFYQSVQFAMPPRYFWPIFPTLAINIGLAYSIIQEKKHNKAWTLFSFFCFILSFFWSVAYINIYTKPHPRVTASQWIYQNVPPGSILSMEHWDDGLPLNLEKIGVNNSYTIIEFPMYAPDTTEKWVEISLKINQIDYLILSSNRVYGSITSAPEKFPLTAQFYNDLFSGKLPFTPVAQFTSRPSLPIPFLNLCITPPFFYYGAIDKSIKLLDDCQGITFVDDYADESWTVYDHPKVTIFKKRSL